MCIRDSVGGGGGRGGPSLGLEFERIKKMLFVRFAVVAVGWKLLCSVESYPERVAARALPAMTCDVM